LKARSKLAAKKIRKLVAILELERGSMRDEEKKDPKRKLHEG